jgi:hypothetical protein
MMDVWSRMFEVILDASGAHKVHVLIVNYKRHVCVCVCVCVCVFDYGG